MKVICINNKDFPNLIPINKHPKEGEIYTVVDFVKCNIQGGLIGYKLAEIELGPECEPYTCFAANRFAIPVEPVEIEETEEILETA